MNKPRSLHALVAALLLALAPVVIAASTITRGKVTDLGVTGGAAVFSSALTVAGGRPSTSTDPGRGVWWNITVSIKDGATDSKLYLREIIDADSSHDIVLNDDAVIDEGEKAGFSVQVHPDHTYNLVLGTTTHLVSLQVEEEP